MTFDPARPGMRTQTVLQGEFKISENDTDVLSTVLGSCVSVALFDPKRRLGGMNHYLLPDGGGLGQSDVKYGAQAIELLINALLKAGARRASLRARLCGGANIVPALGDIGARNAEFARSFVRREGFRIDAEELGGNRARRFQFHPVTGAARVRVVPRTEAGDAFELPRQARSAPADRPDVTLF